MTFPKSDDPIERVWWEHPPRRWWQFWKRPTSICYAATASNKVWVSKDEGVTWAPDLSIVLPEEGWIVHANTGDIAAWSNDVG